jgi:site-specific DNA-methyltransferase (adenine-specific)
MAGTPAGGRSKDTLKGIQERTAPATSEAERWDGWKTQLKPATEYVVVTRAPLGEDTVAENVMEWGTGALNIDGCRIGTGEGGTREGEDSANRRYTNEGSTNVAAKPGPRGGAENGRYPANAAFAEHAARKLDRQSGVSVSSGGATSHPFGETNKYGKGEDGFEKVDPGFGDEGGASRFFYTSKASKAERNLGLPDDEDNEHPTVKPVDLMRWLVQLVTREGQVVVDPFAGSGTTLLAADYLGRDWIGIERDDEHAELARRRVNNYDPSEVDDWIDDESVTQAEQATLGDMATDGGDG